MAATVLTRLHRANILRDIFRRRPGSARRTAPVRQGGARRPGVPARRLRPAWPVSALPQDGDRGARKAARQRQVARNRPRRANPQRPRHFLDSPVGLRRPPLCGSRRLRHRGSSPPSRSPRTAIQTRPRRIPPAPPHPRSEPLFLVRPKHVTMGGIRCGGRPCAAHTMLFAAAIGGLALAVAMSGTRHPLIEEAAAQVRGKPSRCGDHRCGRGARDCGRRVLLHGSGRAGAAARGLHRRPDLAGVSSTPCSKGRTAGIAVTYFEWAGRDRPADRGAVAADRRSRRRQGVHRRDRGGRPTGAPYRTSISGALHFALPLFEASGISRPAPRHRPYRATASTTRAIWWRSCATRCWSAVSPSTACRSCSSALRPPPWISRTSTSTTRIASIGGPGAFVIPIREARASSARRPAPSWCRRIASREVCATRYPGRRQQAAHFLHHRGTDCGSSAGGGVDFR